MPEKILAALRNNVCPDCNGHVMASVYKYGCNVAVCYVCGAVKPLPPGVDVPEYVTLVYRKEKGHDK